MLCRVELHELRLATFEELPLGTEVVIVIPDERGSLTLDGLVASYDGIAMYVALEELPDDVQERLADVAASAPTTRVA
jgi:hypothetical protein